MKRYHVGGMLILLLLSVNVLAHNLRLFASQQGLSVSGETYFAGAGAAANTAIYLEQGGERLLSLSSDNQGQFTLELPKAGHYELIADAGQGHQVSWPLESSAAVSPSSSANTKSEIVPAELGQQLRDLRRDIERLRTERRLQDLIGGLGYILGLAGLAAWLLARRKKTNNAA